MGQRIVCEQSKGQKCIVEPGGAKCEEQFALKWLSERFITTSDERNRVLH